MQSLHLLLVALARRPETELIAPRLGREERADAARRRRRSTLTSEKRAS